MLVVLVFGWTLFVVVWAVQVVHGRVNIFFVTNALLWWWWIILSHPFSWYIKSDQFLWSIQVLQMSSVVSDQFSIAVQFDNVATRFSAFVYHYRWLPFVIFRKDRHLTAYDQLGKFFCVPVIILLLLPAFDTHLFPDFMALCCVCV